MAELFDTTVPNVIKHIGNVFAEGELPEAATTHESSVVQSEGGRNVRRTIKHYNLDVIISVGYRVKSKRGTQFRIWANRVLRGHLLRGYTLNKKRLIARGVEFNQTVALLTATLRKNETLTPEGQAIRVRRDDMVARGENPGMFGQERGDALDSILMTIEQTVFGEPAYPTIESRADDRLLRFALLLARAGVAVRATAGVTMVTPLGLTGPRRALLVSVV